ncbi:MAG: hypothetical protein HY648_01270 [Acidobacteria bacterium]|nr:hypothetical protein [Acidobacteriota bacterium]
MRRFFVGNLLLPFAIALFAQVTDAASVINTNVYQPPNYYTFVPPSAGGNYTDPVFGVNIQRLTNALSTSNLDGGGNLIFITNEYSTMSGFNADNSRILLVHQSYFALYDGSGRFLKSLPFEINAQSEPRWSRSDPNILYYHFVNQLKQYNVTTGASSVVRIFGEYSSVSGKGESDISYDGNHLVLVGDDRYIFVYELSTNTKGPALDSGGRRFDSVYITPHNNVTVSWFQAGTSRFTGIELFDRNMTFLRQLAHAGGHMDVALDTDGSEVLVWTNSNDPQPLANCQNGFVKIKLATGQQTCLLQLDWSLAVHISGAAGWVFVNTYAPGDPNPGSSSWVPYTNEILQIKLDGTEVRRLLHHRSRPFNSYNYQPHVSVSRDGSRFLYSSNYGLQGILSYPSDYSDVYLGIMSGATDISSTGSTTTTSSGTTDTSTSTGGTTTSGSTTTSGTSGSTATAATVRTQENVGVTYTGTWYPTSRSFFDGGSAMGSMDSGSKATFTFTGTGVRWIGYRDEWSGKANVYLDGRFQRTVDSFASPAQAKTVVWSASGLAAATHTVVIEIIGDHSSASAGSWVWVDAFEVDGATSSSTTTSTTTSGSTSTGSTSGTTTDTSGTTTTNTSSGSTSGSTTTTRTQNTSSAVTYSGQWYPTDRSFFDGGNAAGAMEGGAKATFSFTGTGVRWIGFSDEWAGLANVYLDGRFQKTVNTFASPSVAQNVIWSVTGLAATNHTVTIEVIGDHSAASAGSWIWIDAFDVDTAATTSTTTTSGTTSSGTTTSPTTTTSSGSTSGTVTRIEQSSSAASYAGQWYSKNMTRFSGGSAVLAMDPASSVTFTFSGTGVSWIGYRDAWAGIAKVYLDGNLVSTVDTYAAADTANAVLYKASGLSAGSHKLTIQVTGQMNSSSGGAWVWIDAFDVAP